MNLCLCSSRRWVFRLAHVLATLDDDGVVEVVRVLQLALLPRLEVVLVLDLKGIRSVSQYDKC